MRLGARDRRGGRDDARSDHASGLVVERRGLPRGHAVDGLLEQQPEAVRGLLDARGDRGRAPRSLACTRVAPSSTRASRRSTSLQARRLRWGPRRARCAPRRSAARRAAPRPRGRGPGAVPACRRRRPRGGPSSCPGLVADAARGELHALAREEVVERAAAEEADVLALARGGRGQAGCGRLGPHRGLGGVAQRQPQAREHLRRARARACRTDPSRRRRRARRACGRRARRAARSGPSPPARAPSRSAASTSAARR